jgi:hypothetical protein
MREPLTFSRAARYGGGILVILFALAYFVWRPLTVAGPSMGDFAAYYAGGVVWSHGGDPYGPDVWSVEKLLPGALPDREALLPYVGPPLGLPIWAALGVLAYVPAVVVWGIVLAFCLWLLVVIPARLAGRRLDAADGVALVLLASASGPFVDGISLGQAAVPASAAIAVAMACAARKRWWGFGAAAFVAALFKPNLALALAASLCNAAAVIALVVAGAVSALGNVVLAGGIRGTAHYLHLLPAMGDSERFYAYQFTPTSIAFGFGATQRVAVLAGIAVAAVTIVLVALAIRTTRASLVDGIAIACAALPLVIPYVHEPDFLVAFIPAFLVLYRARGTTWLVGTVGLVLLAVDAFALGLGTPGLAFSLVTAAVAAFEAAALARGRGLARRVRLAPLAVCALVLGVGLAAPPHRIPMWPADLPAHFQAPAAASASAAWKDELYAIGLIGHDPWPAFLRTLTLVGCILVAAAMTSVARRR